MRGSHVLCRILHVPTKAYPWFPGGSSSWAPAVLSGAWVLPPPWVLVTWHGLIHLFGTMCCKALYFSSSNEHRGESMKAKIQKGLCKTWDKHEGVGGLSRGWLARAWSQSASGRVLRGSVTTRCRPLPGQDSNGALGKPPEVLSAPRAQTPKPHCSLLSRIPRNAGGTALRERTVLTNPSLTRP